MLSKLTIVDGVHVLPVTLDLSGRDVTLHPVAVETDRGIALVDTGWPGAIEQLGARLEETGFGWDDVWAVVLTHQDVDHAGGLASVLERADPVVFAHRKCARYVDGREHPVKMGEKRYPPAPVDVELAEFVRFDTVAGPMRVVFTPGHAPGHVSLHFPDERVLVAGDALHAPAGELAGPRGPLDEASAIDSIGILSTFDVDRTLCYHGGLVEQGTDAIEAIWREHVDNE